MSEKDITEKMLLSYNDVFSDVINGLVFKGEQKIKSFDLKNAVVHTQYKASNEVIHEEERDVAKYWESQSIKLAMFGVENQTNVDSYMPLRVIGYDGAIYKEQLSMIHEKFYPVVTMVLYFGTDRRWSGKKNLKSYFDIPAGLEKYVNDYKIHVFEIAWLTEEELSYFRSDFKVVANFFVNKRKNKDYIPDDETEIEHVDEVLKLLTVMTGDRRYERILSEGDKKEVRKMCDVAERLEQMGIEKGIKEGIKEARTVDVKILRSLKRGKTVEEIALEQKVDLEDVQKIAEALRED